MPKKTKINKDKPSQHLVEQQVLTLLTNNPGKVYDSKQVARRLNSTVRLGFDVVLTILMKLASKGAIQQVAANGFKAPATAQQTITGRVDYVNARFAFIVTEDTENDIRVYSENMNGALDGDMVKIAIYKQSSGSRLEGEVVEIVTRKRTEFVGTVESNGRTMFVLPDSKKMHSDIFIPPGGELRPFNGDKVVVKIIDWPQKGKNPVGEVIKVLGEAGTHDVEMHAIMAEFELPVEFPSNVERETKKISEEITQDEISKRRDFRKITTFTIDPFDAKDFDDAISIQKLSNGHWEIGVHIADVTHYLKEDTALDEEAFKRATSVYLVDRCIPMLPEKLSNFLCSLRPHEEKLTFSAVFEMDDEGNVLKEWFGRTIIYSDRRFTYEEVWEIIQTGKGDYASEIKVLNDLAHRLRKERFRKGSIAFETQEVKFELDEDGKPLKVIPKVRNDAHKLVEDFMLLANKKVAEFIYNTKDGKNPKTFVYRIHEEPNPEKLESFARFASRFGHSVNIETGRLSHELNRLTAELEGKPEENVVQSLAIRAMSKARYTIEILGHFGLGFKHYTHFTSPIRRYPDVMVHRLLALYLDKAKSADEDTYEDMCSHCSAREKVAADAERASIKYKQVEFMQNMAQQEWEGIVSGITDWGIFVEIIETKCEGMVRLADLTDDFYDFDAENLRVVGRNSKRMITFGDPLRVKIKKTDLRTRTIDLSIVRNESDSERPIERSSRKRRR